MRIFGPKRYDVTGERREIHIEDYNVLYLTQYFSSDEIEKIELSVACSAYGGEERCIQGFGGGNLKDEDHLENSSIS